MSSCIRSHRAQDGRQQLERADIAALVAVLGQQLAMVCDGSQWLFQIMIGSVSANSISSLFCSTQESVRVAEVLFCEFAFVNIDAPTDTSAKRA